ncbi:hypothetical protein CQ018_06530 [Arthrobacter sp. MYb227]|uniref:hypothetical protein n=1 Tax=Arthrobacter sp. MYb227 TaxID=1848601 RepID=UPI000CFAF73E|nr:hypothetical protein [Arthrobacter sp. MYb227]PQZ94987.1 hypothetical protein CQ018_06530 [Arthrobacter sp. MYb227]
MNATAIFSSVLALLLVLISTFVVAYKVKPVKGATGKGAAVVDGVDRLGCAEQDTLSHGSLHGATKANGRNRRGRRLVWSQAVGRLLVRGALAVLALAVGLAYVPWPALVPLWQYLSMLVLIAIVLTFVLSELVFLGKKCIKRLKAKSIGGLAYPIAIVLSFLPPIVLLVFAGEQLFGAMAAAMVVGGAWFMGWLQSQDVDELSAEKQESIGSTGNALLVYGATSLLVLEIYRLFGDERSAYLMRAREAIAPWATHLPL